MAILISALGTQRGVHSHLFSVESEGWWGVAITLATDFHCVPLFDQAFRQLFPQLDVRRGIYVTKWRGHKLLSIHPFVAREHDLTVYPCGQR